MSLPLLLSPSPPPQSYDEVMGIIRSGVPTMATWFYS